MKRVLPILLGISLLLIPTTKTDACDMRYPTAGVSSLMAGYIESAPYHPYIEVEEEEVEEVEEPKVDVDCWKLYAATEFRKLGRVWYGNYTYTWYSEKVLAGGGLNIPDRHNELIDGLPFVCDGDGYIVVASDDYSKGTIVNTPVGRKGKCYDTGSGKGNLDLYVGW